MPIPVKQRKPLPKFKCQFCLSYRATLRTVEKHEGFCWQNPNRYCSECNNTGITEDWVAGDGINEPRYVEKHPCPFCSKEDKELTASLIASRDTTVSA